MEREYASYADLKRDLDHDVDTMTFEQALKSLYMFSEFESFFFDALDERPDTEMLDKHEIVDLYVKCRTEARYIYDLKA